MTTVEQMDFVPEPASGRVFEASLTPEVADVTGTGRSRLDAIARWLQEIARGDLEDAGFEVWIVRRTRISVGAFPQYGQRLALSTFCSGIGRFSAERRTSIRGEGSEVEAVSRWICFDPQGRRPQRFSDDFRHAYAETAGERDANVRVRRIPRRRGAGAVAVFAPTSTSPGTSTTRTTGPRLSRGFWAPSPRASTARSSTAIPPCRGRRRC